MSRGPYAPFLLLTVLLALLCSARPAAAAARVLVVMSDEGGAYEETLAAIQAGLRTQLAPTDLERVDWRRFPGRPLKGSRIIITIGTQAAETVAQRDPDQPVLHTLVPRDTFERLPATKGDVSAIYLDQPVQRQIALLAEALPDWKRLALVAGPRTQALAANLAAAARERGMEVMTEAVNSDREIYPALQRVLSEPAILLAVPDGAVYNSYTIQNVLLTAYRHRSPLVGFSPSYVRAGALLALYSTPTQIGEQAAEAARSVLTGGGLPRPQATKAFRVGINQNVARSLGIDLDPEEVIEARLERLEARR